MDCLVSEKDDQAIVHLHIQPNAAKNRVAGLHDGCLKLAVASPPVDGKANKEVLHFLAGLLGVSPRKLSIKTGLQARRKQVVVEGLSALQIRAKLAVILSQ